MIEFVLQGYVTFDGNGTRKHPLVTIEQYQFESETQMIERVKIGHINELKSYRFEYIHNFRNYTVFPGKKYLEYIHVFNIITVQGMSERIIIIIYT